MRRAREEERWSDAHRKKGRHNDCREHNFIAFQMAKKIHSNMNVYFIRFDWHRRACLVCLNVLCAVSFWKQPCAASFDFYHFRESFSFDSDVCVSLQLISSHTGRHMCCCVVYHIMMIIIMVCAASFRLDIRNYYFQTEIVSWLHHQRKHIVVFSMKKTQNATKFFHQFLHSDLLIHTISGRYFLE